MTAGAAAYAIRHPAARAAAAAGGAGRASPAGSAGRPTTAGGAGGARWVRVAAVGGRGGGRDRGAVLVEFAGLFPLILVMLAAIWQCILIGYTFSLAGNAADEGARAAAAASGDPEGACAEAALEHVPGGWEAEVSCPLEGNVRKATVRLDVPVLFPGGFNLPITVSGSAGTTEENR